MSFRKLKKLASEAYYLLSSPVSFAGFARACQVLGIEVYPRVGGSGVIVRSSRFWLERFRDSNGKLYFTTFKR